jgi:opacity protein-like surface antigen
MRFRLPMIATLLLAGTCGARAEAAWQGCYVGAHAGYAHGSSDITDQLYAQGAFAGVTAWNAEGDVISPSSDGILGGGQLGCDTIVATGIVAGIVGDISALDASASGVSDLAGDTRVSFNADWTATLRARLGTTFHDSLVYVTGGVAFADISVAAYDDASIVGPGIMSISGGETKTGWVVGGGVEWQFAPHMTLGVEYLHIGFGDVTAEGEASNIPGAFPRFEGDLDLDIVRLGLNWRL